MSLHSQKSKSFSSSWIPEVQNTKLKRKKRRKKGRERERKEKERKERREGGTDGRRERGRKEGNVVVWAAVHSEGDQPWDFFGRNDAKAETPVLWPPHAKS